MRMVIAPAKQMKEDTDTLACESLPVFLDKSEILKDYINSLPYDAQKKLWACSDNIARENRDWLYSVDVGLLMVALTAARFHPL